MRTEIIKETTTLNLPIGARVEYETTLKEDYLPISPRNDEIIITDEEEHRIEPETQLSDFVTVNFISTSIYPHYWADDDSFVRLQVNTYQLFRPEGFVYYRLTSSKELEIAEGSAKRYNTWWTVGTMNANESIAFGDFTIYKPKDFSEFDIFYEVKYLDKIYNLAKITIDWDTKTYEVYYINNKEWLFEKY